MTTEVRLILTPDVYVENDGIVFPVIVPRTPLSAVTLLAPCDERGLKSVRVECLRHAADLIRKLWPTLALWLLACQTAWQPNTRMMRHVRLYNWLTRGGIRVPGGERSEEILRESDDGLRWFGRIRVGEDDLFAANDIMSAEPASLLVATAGEAPDLDAFLEGGWATLSSMSIEFWACLARLCEKRDCLLLRPFGSFDDIETGVNIVGSPRLISRIAKRPDPG